MIVQIASSSSTSVLYGQTEYLRAKSQFVWVISSSTPPSMYVSTAALYWS